MPVGLTCLRLVSALLLTAPWLHAELRPFADNPRYWQYHGEPVMLIGGSVDDNLFQIPQLEEHLDAIAAAGGDYVRNTMSDRPGNGNEVHAFHQLADGRYDLDRWNDEYWERFDRFLRMTAEREIFVQIEVWDRFDHSREPWESDPYNPDNNVNYTSAETGLESTYPHHPGKNQQPFFYSTPAQRNILPVLRYQQAFVDRMLDISLRYDHVLYCVDNETSGDPLWTLYWADFLQSRAEAAGKRINLTEMWNARDLQAEEQRRTIDDPARYSYIDASQVNHQLGQDHWNQLVWLRDYLVSVPRPVNTVKIYGADGSSNGRSTADGIERFWRHLLAGTAAMRFHRPGAGQGLSPLAQVSIRSARLVTSFAPPWTLQPDLAVLGEREDNEAYAATARGKSYVVYFPAAGEVSIDLCDLAGTATLRWVDPTKAVVAQSTSILGGSWRALTTPSDQPWVAVISR